MAPESKSDEAYDSIAALTAIYNDGIHNNGKWRGIMDMAPRGLPVFGKVPQARGAVSIPEKAGAVLKFSGADGAGKYKECRNLGHTGRAVDIEKNDAVSFEMPAVGGCDSLTIEVRLLPTHPAGDEGLSFALLIDDRHIAEKADYATKGRSEEWKRNVLENQAIRRWRVANDGNGHRLTLKALTDGVTLDGIMIYRF